MILKAALGINSLGKFLNSMSETVDIGWWSRLDLFDTAAKSVIRSATMKGSNVRTADPHPRKMLRSSPYRMPAGS
jgi:hypothetical protein